MPGNLAHCDENAMRICSVVSNFVRGQKIRRLKIFCFWWLPATFWT